MTTTQLRNAIGEWADHCFTHKTSSQLGVLEEIGEIAHVILKGRQGIRGYDDREKVLREIKDGIADTAIYILHWCKMNDVVPSGWSSQIVVRNEEQCLARLADWTGKLLSVDSTTIRAAKEQIVRRILEELTNLASFYGWDLYEDCVKPTWERVSQRDWKKDPSNGGQPA